MDDGGARGEGGERTGLERNRVERSSAVGFNEEWSRTRGVGSSRESYPASGRMQFDEQCRHPAVERGGWGWVVMADENAAAADVNVAAAALAAVARESNE